MRQTSEEVELSFEPAKDFFWRGEDFEVAETVCHRGQYGIGGRYLIMKFSGKVCSGKRQKWDENTYTYNLH